MKFCEKKISILTTVTIRPNLVFSIRCISYKIVNLAHNWLIRHQQYVLTLYTTVTRSPETYSSFGKRGVAKVRSQGCSHDETRADKSKGRSSARRRTQNINHETVGHTVDYGIVYSINKRPNLQINIMKILLAANRRI